MEEGLKNDWINRADDVYHNDLCDFSSVRRAGRMNHTVSGVML